MGASLRDADLCQNACFFIKFINGGGGGENPFIKKLAKVWYVMKKTKKSGEKVGKKQQKKTRKKQKKARITL